MPLVLLKGGATAGRPAGRGQPHRRARERRPRVRRHVPPGRRRRAPRTSRRRSRPRPPSPPNRSPRARTSRCSRPPVVGAWSPPTRSPRTATSCSRHCPTTCAASIDTKLPPRWSRNNPIDLAGGETRDTIPEVMAMVAEHPDDRRDRLPRPRHPVEPGPADARGPVLPGRRPRAHRRLPRAPGRAVRAGGRRRSATRTGKPILTATELAVADPGQRRARSRSARADGSATPRANRAVTALGHLYRYARFRRRRGLA